MKNVLFIFTQRRTLLLLTLYLLLAFLLMSLNNPFTLRGLRIAILQGISWVNSIRTSFEYFEDLSEENKKLRDGLFLESLKNQKLQENLLENLRLRRLLTFKENSEYNYTSATIIGSGQEQSVRSLILNVGRNDGIRKNFAVVTERGLVGKIFDVDNHYAFTQIVMDRNTLVSARLQKSREVGVIGWSGNLWLDLNYISKEVEIEKGEIVLTSGLSQIYPKGLKIGIVVEIQENDYELYKKIKVKPAVEINQLEEVFVLHTPDSLMKGLTR
jgi:rod shape-determining protein MreC